MGKCSVTGSFGEYVRGWCVVAIGLGYEGAFLTTTSGFFPHVQLVHQEQLLLEYRPGRLRRLREYMKR